MVRAIILIATLAMSVFAQPSVNQLTFEMPYAATTPHGQSLTYEGTLESVTLGGTGEFGCGYEVGPEPNTVWIRLVYGLVGTNSALGVGMHTGCVGTKLRINGQDYGLTITLRVVPQSAVTVTNNAGIPDAELPHCTNEYVGNPRWYLRPVCQETNRRPGGDFVMPPVGQSYTDSFGTKVRVLATGDGNHYASISPFNADESLVFLDGGIYRISDGRKLYTFPTDNIINGNCWFELVSGYENTVTCMEGSLPVYGGQGRIMRYTLPNNCGSPPCSLGSGTVIYRVPAPYNFLTKGGSSGATSDGWAVWSEQRVMGPAMADRVGTWRVCAGKLTVPVGQVKPICYEDLDSNIRMRSADYINLSKAPDANRRRYVVMMSNDPMAGIFTFTEGDQRMTWLGYGPVRSDYPANARLRPKCEIGVENPQHCVQTPHADLMNANGEAYLVGDGTPQIPYGAWITSYRLSAGIGDPDAYKGWMQAEELGGGQQFVSHRGGYVGCAALVAMCVTTDYGTMVQKRDIAGASSCNGSTCTLHTSSEHGWSTGQAILIGANNIGITPGTRATITSVPAPDTFVFDSTVRGSGNQGYVAPDTFIETGVSDEIQVVRKFGTAGIQLHRIADLRGVIYFGYDDYPKPAISPQGRYVIWTTNNGIPGVSYVLLADVGLGSPRKSEQFTGPENGVNVTGLANAISFDLNVPDSTQACTVRLSPQMNLEGPGSQSLTIPGPEAYRPVNVMGLDVGTQYWWRVQCGIHVAAGSATPQRRR
jgi:hypothetical protein